MSTTTTSVPLAVRSTMLPAVAEGESSTSVHVTVLSDAFVVAVTQTGALGALVRVDGSSTRTMDHAGTPRRLLGPASTFLDLFAISVAETLAIVDANPALLVDPLLDVANDADGTAFPEVDTTNNNNVNVIHDDLVIGEGKHIRPAEPPQNAHRTLLLGLALSTQPDGDDVPPESIAAVLPLVINWLTSQDIARLPPATDNIPLVTTNTLQ